MRYNENFADLRPTDSRPNVEEDDWVMFVGEDYFGVNMPKLDLTIWYDFKVWRATLPFLIHGIGKKSLPSGLANQEREPRCVA